MPFSLEPYVSVDVETAGPNPSQYSLLSIGACLVAHPERTFYVELQPVTLEADPSVMAIHGLSLEDLRTRGLPPTEAMKRFADWLPANTQSRQQPIFVGFNAPFDWMFVCDYFHRFVGYNPFGHSALDLKAFYMGLTGAAWSETSMRYVAARYLAPHALVHHALDDALDQAELFRRMVSEGSRRWGPDG